MYRLILRNLTKCQYVTYNVKELCKFPAQHLQLTTNLVHVFQYQRNFSQTITDTIKNTNLKSNKFNDWLLKLKSQHAAMGYLSQQYVQKTLKELPNQIISADESIFLMQACGIYLPACSKEQRMEFFQTVWTYLKNNNLLNQQHYAMKVQVLKHNYMPLENLTAFLAELQPFAQTLDADFYADLLELTCYTGNLQPTEQVLDVLKEQNLPLQQRHYNALLRLHGARRDALAINRILDEIRAANIVTNNDMHTALIISCLQQQDLEKAKSLLQEHSGAFNAFNLLEILHCLVNMEHIDDSLLRQIVKEFPTNYLCKSDLPIELRLHCIDMISNGKLPALFNLISKLPMPKFSENEHKDSYCVSLLRELVRSNVAVEQILQFCQILIESGKNIRALHIANEYALRYNINITPPLLETLAKHEELRTHYFWPLLLQNFRKQGEDGLLGALRLMQQHQVPCDKITMHQYVLPRLSSLQKNIPNAVKQLEDCGIKPSQSVQSIIATLLPQNRITDIINLLSAYPVQLSLHNLLQQLAALSVNVRITRQHYEWARLLSILWQNSDNKEFDFVGSVLQQMLATHARLRSDPAAFLRFLTALQKFNLTIAPETAKTLKENFNSIDNKNQQQVQQIVQVLQNLINKQAADKQGTIKKLARVNNETASEHNPNQSTIVELETQIQLLQSKGQNVRGLLRRYLQLCVRDGLLERALEVKAQCDALKVHESPGLCASIFDMYTKLGNVQEAEKTLERMKNSFPGFQLDEHKFVDYAALLVKHDRLNDAKQLLEERAKTHKIVGGDYIVKNIWQLLKNVAESAAKNMPTLDSDQNITRDIFVLLKDLGYCKVQNTLIGPIIREFLLRLDVRSAIKEFQQLAQQHRCTPLQHELMSLLVSLSNSNAKEYETYKVDAMEAQQLLDTVCKCIAEVHGSANMHSSMLLAFATCGTEKQLRRLLLNPEFALNHENLVKNCEHLIKTDDIDSLLRLAHASRDLPHIIDEQNIYNMILDKYIKDNNAQAALKLYEYLELIEGLKLPEIFIQKLVKFLLDNKVDVPSNMLVKAQIST